MRETQLPPAASQKILFAATRDLSLAFARAKAAKVSSRRLLETGRKLRFGEDQGAAMGSVPSSVDDAVVGMGVLTEIGARLLQASGELLSGTNHYAGAALLRQVVEVEYLTWAFANNKRDSAEWLNSDHVKRREMFTPAKLRSESAGRFLSGDYAHHCEQGGHPVPRAIPLLGSADPMHSQLLLVDLLLHGWRTADNISKWVSRTAIVQLPEELVAAREAFGVWGAVDPLYRLVVDRDETTTGAEEQ